MRIKIPPRGMDAMDAGHCAACACALATMHSYINAWRSRCSCMRCASASRHLLVPCSGDVTAHVYEGRRVWAHPLTQPGSLTSCMQQIAKRVKSPADMLCACFHNSVSLTTSSSRLQQHPGVAALPLLEDQLGLGP